MPRWGGVHMRHTRSGCAHRWAVLLGVLVWSTTAIVWAAGGEHHAEFTLTEEIFRWVNFIILAVVLYIVLSKVLPRALQDHRQQIQHAIEEAKAGRAEAQRLLQENQHKTANLQQELSQLQQQATQEREDLARRMEAEVQQLAARVVAQARVEVERATERARLSLREEAALLTVQIAEDILRRELRDEDQQAIVRRYIARIGELN
jgi:F-type H+-transporting ATPase subunit b